MKTQRNLRSRILAALTVFAPFSAHAHHAEFMQDKPFLQGLSMPVHGVDHLLSALAVGLIASRLGGRSRIQLPLVFALIAVLGSFLNLGGISLPELAVPLAAAAAGLLLSRGVAALPTSLLVVAGAGLFNGQALLESAPLTGPAAVFAAGCVLSALVLCAAGMLLGDALKLSQNVRTAKLVGAGVALLAGLAVAFPAFNNAVISLIE